MAKTDDTYYEDYDLATVAGAATTVSKGTVQDLGWEIWHDGGSGTSTLTILGTMEQGAGTADAVDITNALAGVASHVDTGGGSRFQLVDNAGKLRGFIKIWFKIVLATGGAHDGDYEIKSHTEWNAG